jgi:hypothetical protein
MKIFQSHSPKHNFKFIFNWYIIMLTYTDEAVSNVSILVYIVYHLNTISSQI